ncbi:MAG: RNA pyrophosphohydrolase [Alphaproteobacteria bacterium]|nr:RNA pyrophosphohydrolase [Alphaproteobacteria bacterium]
MTAYNAPDFPPDHVAHRLGWRPCAGIALFNDEGKVFCGKRRPNNLLANAPLNSHLWQLPQGGIDAGEAPVNAAFRELAEETGIRSARLIYELPDWLRYDLPESLIGTALKGRFRGQKQKWFAMQFTGRDDEIDLTAHRQIEFDDWAWRSLDDCVADVIAFKKPIYQELATRFAHLQRAPLI